MRYPKECPVFEIVHRNREMFRIPVGSHVVGEGTETYFGGSIRVALQPSQERRLSKSMIKAGEDHDEPGMVFERHQLRPLTQAARDMLALVTP